MSVRRSALLLSSAAAVCTVAGGAVGAGGHDPSFAPGAAMSGRLGTVADFNGDRKPDLAVIKPKSIAVLLAARGGGFRTVPGLRVAADEALAADFNGDRKTDLAVTTAAGELSVFLGNGAGAFTRAPGSPLKSETGLHAAADLDGNGTIDLAVGIKSLTILLGDGSGRFAPAAGSPVSAGSLTPRHVAVADFDGDGTLDLAVGGDFDAKYLVLLRGIGGGRFGAPSKIPVPKAQTSALAAGDLNRDGKPDLAVASAYDYGLTVLLGDGHGGFRSAAHYDEVLAGAPAAMAVADIDGNRTPDLALAGEDESGVAVLLGDGRGAFRPAAGSSLPFGSAAIAAADVDGDGRTDLVTSGVFGTTILFQTRAAPAVRRSRSVGRPHVIASTADAIGSLDADGTTVAASFACTHVAVWRASGTRVASLESTSGYCGSPVLGGGQVAWLAGGSGNTQETDELLAGPLAGGKVRFVDTVQRTRNTNGATDPGTYLGFLVGSGNALAYNRWFCAATGPLGVCLGPTRQQLVRIAGARRVVIARGARAYALGGAGGGRLAVVSGDTVTVLAPNGARVARVTGEPTRRTALSRSRLAVERTFSLDLYAAATGRKTRSLPLGPAAALGLIGLSDRLALLSGQSGIVLVRLRDGKLVSLPLEDPIDPTLTEAGLFYAYNTPKARVKGHVVFEPTATLLRRF